MARGWLSANDLRRRGWTEATVLTVTGDVSCVRVAGIYNWRLPTNKPSIRRELPPSVGFSVVLTSIRVHRINGDEPKTSETHTGCFLGTGNLRLTDPAPPPKCTGTSRNKHEVLSAPRAEPGKQYLVRSIEIWGILCCGVAGLSEISRVAELQDLRGFKRVSFTQFTYAVLDYRNIKSRTSHSRISQAEFQILAEAAQRPTRAEIMGYWPENPTDIRACGTPAISFRHVLISNHQIIAWSRRSHYCDIKTRKVIVLVSLVITTIMEIFLSTSQ